jgi:hypothetical protein
MKKLFPLSAVLALTTLPAEALGECAVTLPASSPVDVPGSSRSDSFAWYGSEALAVRIPSDGRWRGMGSDRHYRDKFWIWRRGYDAKSEPRPDLFFAGMKLNDGEKPERFRIDGTTGAYGLGWSQMLVGMQFPSGGCWQVTANYTFAGITQNLTFVVEVVGE